MQNQIPNNWQKVRLGEVANVKGGKRLPQGFSVQEKKTNHPYLRIVDMNENGIDTSNIKYISEEVFKKISQYTISDKDLYISIAGTIGFVGKIPQFLSGSNLTENCAKICNFSGEIDRNFLLFFLKSHIGKGEIKAGTGGSSQPKLALHRISNFQLLLPPIGTQKYISSILSSFDDKIELNNKITKTSEDIASAIFKEWFGKKTNNKEQIMKNLIKDIAFVKTGNRPGKLIKKKENKYTIPIYGAKEIMGYTSKSLYNQQIIITGRVGTIGEVTIINEPSWPSDNALILIPKDYNYFYFIYFVAKMINYLSLNRGSSQPLIAQSDIENYVINLPDKTLIFKFNLIVSKLFLLKENKEKESQKLAVMRDLLLPKLMKGEIRVN